MSDPPIREAVVEAMVAWRSANRHGPRDDPDRTMWALVNDATETEILEAMRRLRERLRHV